MTKEWSYAATRIVIIALMIFVLAIRRRLAAKNNARQCAQTP
jgi:hypothetical protein